MISPAFIQSLTEKVRIEDIVAQYTALKPSGKNFKGLCPFHGERTPSFTVYPDTNSFYCFGCQAGGGLVNFIQKAENLSYVEAVGYICEKNNIPLPDDSGNFDDSLFALKRRIYSANREAARFFNKQLFEPKNRYALEYFLKRGITVKTINHFGLGFAPNDWRALLEHLKAMGYTSREMLEANLIKKSQKGTTYDNFRNRVIFPIIDVKGNVVAFGARVLDDSKPKYVNTSDTPVYTKGDGVYALNFAKRIPGRKLILVEGYMDVISLHQAGIENAVACLGTAFTDKQTGVLSDYADEILICYDNDEAGKKATERVLKIFDAFNSKNQRNLVKIRVITMQGGKDADEIIRTNGKEAFERLINLAGNELDYRLEKLRRQYDIQTIDGKVNFINKACELLAGRSDTDIDVYSTGISNELGINKEAIKSNVASKRAGRYRREKIKKDKELNSMLLKSWESKINSQKRDNLKAASAEEMLISALFQNNDYYKHIKAKISPEDFVTDFNKKVARLVFDALENGVSPNYDIFGEEFSEGEISEIKKINIANTQLPISLSSALDCVKTIKGSTINKPVDAGSLSNEEWLRIMTGGNKK